MHGRGWIVSLFRQRPTGIWRIKRSMLPRNFWKVWTASTASNVGDGVVLVAIPLITAQLTREPLAVAEGRGPRAEGRATAED